MSEAPREPEGQNDELLSALSGQNAANDGKVVEQTRRVVSTSLGVLRGQQAGLRHNRAVALAGAVVVLLLLGPLLWPMIDSFFEDDVFQGQIGLPGVVLIFLTAAVLASAVLAGWVRRKP